VSKVAIVVPVYAGEAYLRELARQVELVRLQWQADRGPANLTSLLFVTDDPVDNSAAVVEELAAKHDWIRVVTLSRNYGQHPATIAGILNTEEDWVVTLDEDLQHPPARIADLLAQAVGSKSDIVYGHPQSAVHEARSRDVSSRLFKRVIAIVSGDRLILEANSFRLIRGAIARAAAKTVGYDTYFDVALFWFTRRVTTVKMVLKDIRYIESGESSYRFHSLLSHARRLLFSNQIRVLRFGALVGGLAAMASAAVGLLVFALRILAPDLIGVSGWASLMITIAFLGGALMLMLGIAQEILSLLLMRSSGRPVFFVVDRSGDRAIASWFAARTAGSKHPEIHSEEAEQRHS
jgi:glycosyltransferase involved in cell wall biosynthesis